MLRDKLAARLAEMGASPNYSRLATEVLGISGAPPELAQRLVAQALVVGDRHDAWRRVGQRVCRQTPTSPGVYVFRDEDGRALYVGKAKNLRRRLSAHFADRRWLALKPALARVANVEWQVVGCEIEALIREASLIRELTPVVNVQVGAPTLRQRSISRTLVRDVVVLAPAVDPESAALVAARADGCSMLLCAPRSGPALAASSDCLWDFFQRPFDERSHSRDSLAPLVFSWLAGRGRDATRLDPHDAQSSHHFHARLARLLADQELFAQRLTLV
jgi:predicted GIY-YIG superfamily endonuclease